MKPRREDMGFRILGEDAFGLDITERQVLGAGRFGGGVSVYTIAGTVYNTDGSTPVPGATVALGALTAISAANGTYTIADVPAGTSGSMTCTLNNYVWPAKTIVAMSGDLTGQDYTAYDYAAVLVNTYGADEVWPLVDIASGTTITAKVAAARNGVESGWDLRNAAGPIASLLAPTSGGTDYGNIYSVSLSGIFDGDVFGIFALCQTTTPAWSDGSLRPVFQFRVDSRNNFIVYKSTTANRLTFNRRGANAQKNINIDAQSQTGWFSVALTCDTGAGVDGELKAFIDGLQVGATQTGLAAFESNVLDSVTNLIGNTAVGSAAWIGQLAFVAVKFGAAWTPTQIAEMDAALNP